MTNTQKYALVTGSSRGIGRGIALKLASQGINVALNYIHNEAAAQDTLAQVLRHGVQAFAMRADVSQPAELTQLFARVRAEFGALDIFVANAMGDIFSVLGPPLTLSAGQFNKAAASQGQAFLLGVQQAVELMQGEGRIVAITYLPGSGKGSWQAYSAQGAAKASLEALCRYFAVSLAKRGITVNAISPGITEDAIMNALPAPVQDLIRVHHQKGWTPMGRLGTPADIGNAVALLCSPEARWITGQTIAVDGGASLMSADLPLEVQLG